MGSNVENSKNTAGGMAVEATSPWPNSQQKGSIGVDGVKGLVTRSHSKDNYEGWGQLLPLAMGPSQLHERPSAGETSNVSVPQRCVFLFVELKYKKKHYRALLTTTGVVVPSSRLRNRIWSVPKTLVSLNSSHLQH